MKKVHLFVIIILTVCIGAMGFMNISSGKKKIESEMLIYELGYTQGVLNGMRNLGNKEAYEAQMEIDLAEYQRTYYQ